jgi:hypothetical protein
LFISETKIGNISMNNTVIKLAHPWCKRRYKYFLYEESRMKSYRMLWFTLLSAILRYIPTHLCLICFFFLWFLEARRNSHIGSIFLKFMYVLWRNWKESLY